MCVAVRVLLRDKDFFLLQIHFKSISMCSPVGQLKVRAIGGGAVVKGCGINIRLHIGEMGCGIHIRLRDHTEGVWYHLMWLCQQVRIMQCKQVQETRCSCGYLQLRMPE